MFRGEESVSSLQTRKVDRTKRSVDCFNRFWYVVGETCRTGKVYCGAELQTKYWLYSWNCQGMLKRTSTVFIWYYLEKSCQTCEDFKDGSVDLNQWGHANNLEWYRFIAISTGNDTHRNPIRQELNYNESAALIDAHLKRYKFRTEDDVVATQSTIDWTIRMQHRLWKTKVRIAGCIQRQKELPWKRNRSFLWYNWW